MVLTAALAMAASPTAAAVPPVLPLLALPHLVSHLLRSLVPPLLVASQTWGDQEYYGPRRYIRGEDRVPYLVRPLVLTPRVVPRTWSDHESYRPQRYSRGEERRSAGPEQGRRDGRYSERRGHGDYGNWRR